MVKLNIMFSLLLTITLAGPVLGSDGTNGLLAILSDYGNSDYYAGMLEGAIYSVSTDIKVSTITNEVWPFDIPDGAFILYEASKAYPTGTTFVAIVDPGVGTERMPIVLKTKDGKYFVGPDNGLLDLVADKFGVAEIRRIENTSLMRKKPTFSTTFHGRDIFGPVAAHIAMGTPLEEVGPPIASEHRISLPRAIIEKDDSISGETLYVDHYGNLTTNIEPKLLSKAGFKEGDMLTIKVGRKKIKARLSKAYGDVQKNAYVCLIGSSGFLEVAVNQGSLIHRLKLKVKPPITIKGRKTRAKR